MLSPYTCVSCDQPLIQHDEHSFIHYCINPNCEEAKLHLSLLKEMGVVSPISFLFTIKILFESIHQFHTFTYFNTTFLYNVNVSSSLSL